VREEEKIRGGVELSGSHGVEYVAHLSAQIGVTEARLHHGGVNGSFFIFLGVEITCTMISPAKAQASIVIYKA
jgi:hypothetical protein